MKDPRERRGHRFAGLGSLEARFDQVARHGREHHRRKARASEFLDPPRDVESRRAVVAEVVVREQPQVLDGRQFPACILVGKFVSKHLGPQTLQGRTERFAHEGVVFDERDFARQAPERRRPNGLRRTEPHLFGFAHFKAQTKDAPAPEVRAHGKTDAELAADPLYDREPETEARPGAGLPGRAAVEGVENARFVFARESRTRIVDPDFDSARTATTQCQNHLRIGARFVRITNGVRDEVPQRPAQKLRVRRNRYGNRANAETDPLFARDGTEFLLEFFE